MIYEIFLKQNPILHHLEIVIDLDHQIYLMNNLDLERMDICSENNFSKMKQWELSKLINDRTMNIKPADKEGRAVILFTEHCNTD